MKIIPRIVPLTLDQLLCEDRADPEPHSLYSFRTSDVGPRIIDDAPVFDGDVFCCGSRKGGPAPKDGDNAEEPGETPIVPDLEFNSCACVLLLIVSKTPKSGGGSLRGSRYRNGRWRNREFVRKWTRALATWQDCADFCVYVYDDLDVSQGGYDRFYGRNINNELIEFPDIRNHAGDFMDKLQQDFRWLVTGKCFTFVIHWNHAWGSPSGTTPMDVVNPNAPSSPMSSENLCFVTDTLPWYKIAHELGHMANILHCKDNQIHRRNGQFDPKFCPPGQKRGENDLMNPRSSETPTIRLVDCALFLDHIANHKTCDHDTTSR